jgi:hypothetical protein
MKYESVGRAIRATYRCEGRVIRGDVQTDCRAPNGARLEEDLARADRFGPCPGTNESVVGGAAFCTPFVREGGALTCRLAKLRAAEAKSIGKLRCYREGVRTGKPLDECFAAVEARFLAAFAQAERDGVCGDPFNGTAEAIERRVDQCVFLAAVPLSCGNGQIDPGEQCDGQPFCRPVVCQIFLPQCCQFGSPPNALCVATDVAIELCGDNGGSVGVGFCADAPCPGDPFPGCMVGACGDPPIADTRVCCLLGDTCQGSSVATTLGLRSALLACSTSGGTAALGTCGVDGSCIRD